MTPKMRPLPPLRSKQGLLLPVDPIPHTAAAL